MELPASIQHARGAVAALVRSRDGAFVGTCFRVSASGHFLGAEHYLHSNGVEGYELLSIRTGDGRLLPLQDWNRELPGDLVEFRCEPEDRPVLSPGPTAELPADGSTLHILGYGAEHPTELRVTSGAVSGRERIQVDPVPAFEGFYVECEAVDGMSGSPAIDAASGAVVALLSGLNPDWGIAAFCPLPSLSLPDS